MHLFIIVDLNIFFYKLDKIEPILLGMKLNLSLHIERAGVTLD